MHREDIGYYTSCGLKDSPSHPVLITRLHPGSACISPVLVQNCESIYSSGPNCNYVINIILREETAKFRVSLHLSRRLLPSQVPPHLSSSRSIGGGERGRLGQLDPSFPTDRSGKTLSTLVDVCASSNLAEPRC
jgi:hypothetical protein